MTYANSLRSESLFWAQYEPQYEIKLNSGFHCHEAEVSLQQTFILSQIVSSGQVGL